MFYIAPTVLHIAAKYEEIYPPHLDKIIALFLDWTLDEQQKILDIEEDIHTTLKFEYLYVSPFYYLPRLFHCSKINDKKLFYLAQFILEMTLLEYKMLCYRSSILAASSFYLAFKILYEHSFDYTIFEELKITTSEIRTCVTYLCPILIDKKFDSCFIYKQKFYEKRFLGVARDCYNKLKKINVI